MPKTKQRHRKIELNKCPICQKTFESNRNDAKTCSVGCRQALHQQELAKRITTYSITTPTEFKAGIVEVLPRLSTRYDSAGQLWVDFNWSPIPQRQKDLMEVYAVAEGVTVDTLQRDFEQTILERMVKFQAQAKRDRDAQEAQGHRTAEIAELKADLARLRASIAADQEAMKEAVRTGQPIKFQKV